MKIILLTTSYKHFVVILISFILGVELILVVSDFYLWCCCAKCVFLSYSGLDVAAVDDHTSPTNLVSVLGRFTLGEVVIHISKSADKIDTQYLMLRIDRVCMDVAMTTYGVAFQANLGGVEVVDKIHLGMYLIQIPLIIKLLY